MTEPLKPRPDLVQFARTVFATAPKGSVFFVGLQSPDGHVASMSNLLDGPAQAAFLRGFVASFETGAAEYERVDAAPAVAPSTNATREPNYCANCGASWHQGDSHCWRQCGGG